MVSIAANDETVAAEEREFKEVPRLVWLFLVLVIESGTMRQTAPTPLTVSGVVLDPAEAVVPDATVTLRPGDGGQARTLMTDESGARDRPAGVRRNTLQGPAPAAFDVRWSREFYLQEKKRDKGASLTVGVDAFNVLNRVNYVGNVGNLSSPFFGQPVAARPARRTQFSLRFKF